MTNPNTQSASHELATRPNPTPPLPNPASRIFLLAIVVIIVAIVAAFATSAFSQGFGGFGGGFGPGFGPPWASRSFDPAAIEDRADRMVRHLSIELDATAEQQERLRSIMRSAVRDLLPLREKAMNSRQRARELLTQTTIDRAAIETLRTDQMALADQATRRVSQAIGDAASVLTVEQRRKLAERIDAMHAHRWGPPRWGWHRG